MDSKAEVILQKGAAILSELLLAHGFQFSVLTAGSGSGGEFATGEFIKGARSLEIHFRYSLGMVSYRYADRSISHQDYMRSMMGRTNSSHYPGFSSDPLDGFRHLKLDLEEYGSEFLDGTDECLRLRFDQVVIQPENNLKLPD